MRTLAQLYTIIKSHYEYNTTKDKPFSDGICYMFFKCYSGKFIELEEYMELQIHFADNKPDGKQYREFFESDNFIDSNFWWGRSPKKECDAERLKFLDKMIALTESELV